MWLEMGAIGALVPVIKTLSYPLNQLTPSVDAGDEPHHKHNSTSGLVKTFGGAKLALTTTTIMGVRTSQWLQVDDKLRKCTCLVNGALQGKQKTSKRFQHLDCRTGVCVIMEQ